MPTGYHMQSAACAGLGKGCSTSKLTDLGSQTLCHTESQMGSNLQPRQPPWVCNLSCGWKALKGACRGEVRVGLPHCWCLQQPDRTCGCLMRGLPCLGVLAHDDWLSAEQQRWPDGQGLQAGARKISSAQQEQTLFTTHQRSTFADGLRVIS